MTKILLIEDESALREAISDQLMFKGYDVVAVESGEEGVEQARSYLPDAIVCDIRLPQMSGYAVLETLRQDETTAPIPFIFLTAHANRMFMRHAMELGADDFLAKPFTQEELFAAIQSRLERQHFFHNAQPAAPAPAPEADTAQATRTLTRMIVHELRTPLIGMKMANDLIDRQLSQLTPEELREYLGMIRANSQRLQHLVEQIILQFQIDAGTYCEGTVLRDGMEIMLSDLLMGAINHARQFAYRNQTLSIVVQDRGEQISLYCLTVPMKHALAELLVNALNFSPEFEEVIVSTWTANGRAWLSILDRGPGIPADKLAEAMEPLTQIDREHREQQGIGMGLPLARRVIGLHGGTLELNSVVGKGTQVTVGLPLHPDLA